jgi:shikimate dehydrogenase
VRCQPDGICVDDNFDGAGCVGGLRAAGHVIAERNVLLLGAGGAGRAVAHELAGAGVSRMRLFETDRHKCEDLLEGVRVAYPSLFVETGAPDLRGST